MATEIFRIKGGMKLSGRIEVRGSKNAAAPIIAATLLTTEPCVLNNIPRIEDVFRLLEIIESIGAKVEWVSERSVRIEAKEIFPERMSLDEARRVRMSVLLFGSLAARCDRFDLGHPGGCAIGARSIETHVDALEKLGIKITKHEKHYEIDATGRRAGKVIQREFSVTSTEDVLMLAAALPGKTVIKIAAAEPHVEDLGKFLVAMGAKIEGLGSHTITVEGSRLPLHGAEHTVIPDPIEATTFLVLGAVTESEISVVHAREEHLESVLEKMRDFGVDFRIDADRITVLPTKQLVSPGKIKSELYPGIPTDVLSLFAVLATRADGDTLIHEHMYEGRFNYISEFEKMRIRATILNPHQAVIHGPARLRGTTIKSFDLRAGAALIIAALAAEGTTTIEDIYQVDRGYERIEERLQKIGAKIERVKL
ncbi:MAG: UDP-N-acetylglucosamine 1-carboxyvinyltransferase [Candidatus Moraniibacteriota bacterium]